ncbi:hypothetical protein [Nocardioides conyzicola]|uniref:Adenylate cyclase n=1 Tax=Nocardioides conyzicola TaxID=1651781 RepID=A0ABP8WMU6_9ACTN
MDPTPTSATLSDEALVELVAMLPAVDSVELKLCVPDGGRRSAVAALRLDPLQAELRQAVFFDTADLALDRCGVVLRARRIRDKPGDTVVKIRPIQPEAVPQALRDEPGFSLEVDALPGGFTCSGSMRHHATDADVRSVMQGAQSVRTLLSRPQRRLYAAHVGDDGPRLDRLSVLGPITIMKLKWRPPDVSRRFVAELWLFPDGGRTLELSTKCAPGDAFAAAAEAKAFLISHGIDLTAEQQTKTRAALAFFSLELARP